MSRGSDMLSIIISTRNRAAVLRDCLDALARDAADDISYEAMVVDNASTDDTQEVLHIEMERGRLPLQGVG